MTEDHPDLPALEGLTMDVWLDDELEGVGARPVPRQRLLLVLAAGLWRSALSAEEALDVADRVTRYWRLRWRDERGHVRDWTGQPTDRLFIVDHEDRAVQRSGRRAAQ